MDGGKRMARGLIVAAAFVLGEWAIIAPLDAPTAFAQEASRTIAAREIPVPAAASRELRDAIAATPATPVPRSAPSTVAE